MCIKGRCVVAGTMEVDGDQMDGLFIEVPMAILRNSKNLIYCDVEVSAAEEHGVAALQTTNSSSHKMPSFAEVYTEWSGVNTHLSPKTDRERIIAHDIYNIIARHFGH